MTDLKPDTSYVFVVRAENANGMSVPSEMSAVAHTLAADSEAVPLHQLEEARVRLAAKVVVLASLTPASSTSCILSWEVSKEKRGMNNKLM